MFEGKVVGVDLEKAINHVGIDVTELLTFSEALALFEQKGFSTNFYKEIDIAPELTNQNLTRYIKVAETDKQNVSFNLTGGSDDKVVKTDIQIKHDGTNLTFGEAVVFTFQALALDELPKYYYNIENNKISIYIAVPDTIQDKYLLLTEVYADDTGEYGLLGSRTTSQDLTEIPRNNIAEVFLKQEIDDTKLAEAEAGVANV